MERWLAVPGYEDTYEVSDAGRVRSIDRFDSLGRSKSGVLLTPWIDKKQRPNVGLKGKRVLVCSLVLAAFVGSRPEGMECCHGDGMAGNNQLENLRWDTRSSNAKDAVKHGTNHHSKKTHCPAGHPLVEENLVKWALRNGTRHCLICQRSKSLESYYRNKAPVAV